MTDRPTSTAVVADDLDPHREASDQARPMRADARRNYERLVTAARDVFNQQGGDASMDAIAKEAGVGVGTLYRHFPKRIDVVEAVYKTDVDGLEITAETVVATLEPWPALVAWLEAFVQYASTKRNFLSDLHEAFEKSPQLRIASRERIEGALSIVFDPRPAGGGRSSGSRRARCHAAPGFHVHERDAHERSKQATAGHDPRRAASANLAMNSSCSTVSMASAQ